MTGARLDPAPRVLGAWIMIAAAETGHGVLRRWLLEPLVGDATARRLCVFSGAAIVFGVAWLAADWMGLRTRRGLLGAGLAWVVLTLFFEVAAGRLLGLSWSRIGADYDIAQGGLMPVGLVAMGFSPLLARRLRDRRPILEAQS